MYIDEKRWDTAKENNIYGFSSLLLFFIALSLINALPTIWISLVVAPFQYNYRESNGEKNERGWPIKKKMDIKSRILKLKCLNIKPMF